MQSRYVVMIFALFVAGISLIAAQQEPPNTQSARRRMILFNADPFVGTWKLEVAKSKFNPGPPLKSGKAKIEAQGEGIRCILDPVSAEGQARHGEWTAQYDGKDYPAAMTPFADAIALNRINGNTVEAVYKRGGKEILSERWVLSRDRKVLTITQTEKNATGKGFINTLVYSRE